MKTNGCAVMAVLYGLGEVPTKESVQRVLIKGLMHWGAASYGDRDTANLGKERSVAAIWKEEPGGDRHTHFVCVKERLDNGDYVVFDPDGRRTRTLTAKEIQYFHHKR
jgi:1-acyl-sn-glycerol-3-phosphate acyltransferase